MTIDNREIYSKMMFYVFLKFDHNSQLCFFDYRATTNKKMRETVALELSFVNSNLQLLKEQLAELNR